MERKFIKTRSLKDIIIFTSIFLVGCYLVMPSNGTNANIGGYILIITGIILAFTLKSSYKHFHSGEKFQKKTTILPFKYERRNIISN